LKTGEYKVKFNYTILRGFIDAFGLVMTLLIYQTTYAYYDKFIHPDQVINNVYPNGVPLDRWILGGIVPLIALAVLVFSVVYMFIPHKSRTLMIAADNAQKYYDNLMIANSLLRILALMALWDYTYISQSNLLYAGESWFSLQTVLDIVVGALVVYFMYGRLKAIAKPVDKKKKAERKSAADEETTLAKVKIVKDDDTIMRS
jgi:uncharacterized membrane protein